MDAIRLHYTVPGDDFTRAGEASADLKARLLPQQRPAAPQPHTQNNAWRHGCVSPRNEKRPSVDVHKHLHRGAHAYGGLDVKFI